MMSEATIDRPRRPRPQQPQSRHGHHHHHHHQRHHAPSRSLKSVRHVSSSNSDGELGQALALIVPLIGFSDLLTLRLVSKRWNRAICGDHETGKVKGQVTIGPLWTRGRLYFDPNMLSYPPDANHRVKTEVLIAQFAEFSKSSLITEFHCPKYRFVSVDTRFEVVRKFFHENGPDIKSLRLNNCILSLVSFQRIIHFCSSLEALQMTGIFHCLVNTESLLPSKRDSSLPAFVNLRTLIFESSYVLKLFRHKLKFGRQSVHRNRIDTLEIQDLHPLMIREILLSATQLQSVTFTGFGIATVNRVLLTLAQNPVHANLTSLAFYDIPNAATPSCLGQMTDLAHLKLKKFALTFLGCELQNVILGTDENACAPVLENLDELVRKVLCAHQNTLETLDLRNCNVTEAIFAPSQGLEEVSALRQLRLQGTQIKELSENSKYVLRKYLEGDGAAGLREGGAGPIPRATVDEIIDAALYDDSANRAAAAAGRSDPEPIHPVPVPAAKCCKQNTSEPCCTWISTVLVFVIAAILALGVVALFYFLITWYGSSLGRIIFLVAIGSFFMLCIISSLITSSLSD